MVVVDGETRGGRSCGNVNQGDFSGRFAAVLLLTVPVEAALYRVTTRTGNEFGKAAEQRRRIAADFATVEPLVRRRVTLQIDTRCSVHQVASAVLSIADGPASGPGAQQLPGEWQR